MARKDLKLWLNDNEAPPACGIYQFLDVNGDIIYVGKSVNLQRRMQQYLSPSRKRKNHKRRKIVADACRVHFELCDDEKAALLRENELIQSLRPRFNTAGAFSFLYPVIAASYSERRLVMIHTTMPDTYHEYQRYGAFRDRHLVKEAFSSLVFLFGIIGHSEPASRLKDVPRADYSRRVAFREISAEYWPLLTNFLLGDDDQLLPYLFNHLLNHRSAIHNAAEVELCLKTLRLFYRDEARRLKMAREASGHLGAFVEQQQRDALFIELK